ncbi:MAG: TetR/AcrR family transcriptional regulator [Stackebrandtia sp.]
MAALSGRPVGRPPRISRQEIVDAAKHIVDREGVEKLTMRRLARDIGSAPMALYYHVRDKRQLLLALLDDIADEIPRPELPAEPAARIIAAAVTIRDGLLRFPWAVEVLADGDLLSTEALWYPEVIIDAAMRSGLDEDQAVHAYRSIWFYTVGEITVHTAALRRSREEASTHEEKVFADLDAERTPRLAALGDRWFTLMPTDTFRPGLQALVTGLLNPPSALSVRGPAACSPIPLGVWPATPGPVAGWC